MCKYVVYTVMVGTYGEVYQPQVVDDRFDYVLFSNNIEKSKVGIWNIRKFNSSAKDPKRDSRYPKTHPCTLLSEYEASLYIDANIEIVDSWVYDRFIELVNDNVILAGVQLVVTGRDCIYRHSYDMCVMMAEHDYKAIRQMHKLYRLGFPEHYGLNENNVIFRMHCRPIEDFDNEWWRWIEKYSYRDQFSFMYCMWKHKLERVFFLPKGIDTGSSSSFVRHSHNELPNVAKQKWVKPTFFERLRNKWRRKHLNYERYCQQWVELCKRPLPVVSLFFWGIVVSLRNIFYFAVKYVKQREYA